MLTRLQEISLIARCVAADDRHAFGELVEAYSDNLRRFLLSLTKGDVSLVDDLAQETFIKAYLSKASHAFTPGFSALPTTSLCRTPAACGIWNRSTL